MLSERYRVYMLINIGGGLIGEQNTWKFELLQNDIWLHWWQIPLKYWTSNGFLTNQVPTIIVDSLHR